MKILIAPDKFKGSLSATEAAQHIAEGFQNIFPAADCQVTPIADGGEGTAEALVQALGGRWVEMEACDPLSRPVNGRYGWLRTTPEAGEARIADAVAEMSEFSGYWRVDKAERDPLRATTYGTGQVLRDAAQRGASALLLGIGGSATNDGGVGMARALGYRFLDENGSELPDEPQALRRLEHIQPPENLVDLQVIVASDVENPLLGPNGATAVYGPQKGVTEETQPILEDALARLVEVVKRDLGKDLAEQPGAGAAGGLGYGLMVFAGAELRPGFDLIADLLDLRAKVADSDLVITGEGSIDAQTLHGKGPAGVAELARNAGKPCLAFAGHVEDVADLKKAFTTVTGIVQNVCELSEAMDKAGSLLRDRAELVARLIKLGKSL